MPTRPSSTKYVSLHAVFAHVWIAKILCPKPYAISLDPSMFWVGNGKCNLYFATAIELVEFYKDKMGFFGLFLPSFEKLNAGHYCRSIKNGNMSIFSGNINALSQALRYEHQKWLQNNKQNSETTSQQSLSQISMPSMQTTLSMYEKRMLWQNNEMLVQNNIMLRELTQSKANNNVAASNSFMGALPLNNSNSAQIVHLRAPNYNNNIMNDNNAQNSIKNVNNASDSLSSSSNANNTDVLSLPSLFATSNDVNNIEIESTHSNANKVCTVTNRETELLKQIEKLKKQNQKLRKSTSSKKMDELKHQIQNLQKTKSKLIKSNKSNASEIKSLKKQLTKEKKTNENNNNKQKKSKKKDKTKNDSTSTKYRKQRKAQESLKDIFGGDIVAQAEFHASQSKRNPAILNNVLDTNDNAIKKTIEQGKLYEFNTDFEAHKAIFVQMCRKNESIDKYLSVNRAATYEKAQTKVDPKNRFFDCFLVTLFVANFTKNKTRRRKRKWNGISEHFCNQTQLKEANMRCLDDISAIRAHQTTHQSTAKKKKSSDFASYSVNVVSRVLLIWTVISTYFDTWYYYPLLRNKCDFQEDTLKEKFKDDIANESYSQYLISSNNASNNDKNIYYFIKKEFELNFLFMIDGCPVKNVSCESNSITNMGLKPRGMRHKAASTLDVWIPLAVVAEDESGIVSRKIIAENYKFLNELVDNEKYKIIKKQQIVVTNDGIRNVYDFELVWGIKIGLCCDAKAESMIVGAMTPASTHCFWRVLIDVLNSDEPKWLERGKELQFTDLSPWLYGKPRPAGDCYRLVDDDDNFVATEPIETQIQQKNDERAQNNQQPLTYWQEHDLRVEYAKKNGQPFIHRCPSNSLSLPNRGWMHSFIRPLSNVSSWLTTLFYGAYKSDTAIKNLIAFYAKYTCFGSIARSLRTRFESSIARDKPLRTLYIQWHELIAINKTGEQGLMLLFAKSEFMLCFDNIARAPQKSKIAVAVGCEIFDMLNRYVHILLNGATLVEVEKYLYDARRLHKQIMKCTHKLDQPSISYSLIENPMILYKYFHMYKSAPLQDSDEMIEMFCKWMKTFLKDHNNHDTEWLLRSFERFEIGHLLAYAYNYVTFGSIDKTAYKNASDRPKLKKKEYTPIATAPFDNLTKILIKELRDQRINSVAKDINQTEMVRKLYQKKLTKDELNVLSQFTDAMQNAQYHIDDEKDENETENSSATEPPAKKRKMNNKKSKQKRKAESESDSDNERMDADDW